jgi:sulfoxide reductase heme-binding subunit YedZ
MNNQPTASQLSLIKAALFVLALLPFARLVFAALTNNLGPEPVEFVQRWTGTWTINLLLLTLCISPLRVATQWHWILRLRRTLGLFTFFYALLHFLSFIGFEHSFNLDEIARDIFKRPYVLLGFAAFAILIPLAATSNQFAIRRLGGRRWQELHRSIYLIAILGCLHYFWLTKAENLMWPVAYSVILGLLLRWRIRERKRKAVPVPQALEEKPLRFFKQKPDY